MNSPLITRLCECGCGKSFRCLPNSPSRFYSVTHQFKTVDAFARDYETQRLAKSNARKALYDRLAVLAGLGIFPHEIVTTLNNEGHRIKGDKLTIRKIHSTCYRLGIKFKDPRKK